MSQSKTNMSTVHPAASTTAAAEGGGVEQGFQGALQTAQKS